MEEAMEEYLRRECKLFARQLRDYIAIVENNNFTDKSWFLDFEDELNEMSTLDHSKRQSLD